eukprot:SAG11_NODE_17725_length_510_cov_1.345499_1_plen_23_part_10
MLVDHDDDKSTHFEHISKENQQR